MKKSLIKDTKREIHKSLGRFFSIFSIVMVGVAFFTGVKASSPYMKKSADTYFDNTNFMDYKLISSIGFSDEDIEKIRELSEIEGVQGNNTADTVVSYKDNEVTVQFIGYDFSMDENDSNNINRIDLTEGRFPQKAGECVVRDYAIGKEPMEIGDVIELKSDDNSGLKSDKYTVVGKISTPYYLSYQYDNTTVGSGKLSDIFFVSKDEIEAQRYSVAYVTVKGAKQPNTYEDDYFDKIALARTQLEGLHDDLKNQYSMVPDYKWYVLDRKSHFSYVDYENCCKRMDAIASVFPVFFYLVAALVCLTTMTRMVDEQRNNIGTLKALGYGSFSISMKFLSYAFIASVTGGIVGCLIGLNTLPRIIFNSWNIVYTVRDFAYENRTVSCIIAVGISVMVNIVATLFSCMSVLTENPASLLRPKAPKAGKKIFLEYIGFIWKRFNFIKKVTARNIFRYKKRFFMTVIGIAGCTALILAGYGIKNSVSEVTSGQYGEIFNYNMSGRIKDGRDIDEFYREYSENEKVDRMYLLSSITSVAKKADEPGLIEKRVTLISVDDGKDYAGFTNLTSHSGKNKVVIPTEGAVITYKLAKDFNLDIGDEIYVSNGQDEFCPVTIKEIVDMYVGQYVFVDNRYYENVFGKTPQTDSFVCQLNISGIKEQEKFGTDIMKKYDLENVSYYDEISKNFNKTVSSLSLITLVLIVSAGLLAFAVLYNLINVNISERIREIATIKVLGFYDNEVNNYVYRENVILSIIGAFFGLFLGIGLHRYIMKTIEMDDVIFPNVIKPQSFVFAFVITVIFGLLVNLTMNKRLRNIKMVESLKSVE